MTRRIICVTLIITFASFIYSSCQEGGGIGEARVADAAESAGGLESLGDICEAPEVFELESIRDRLAAAARNRGVCGEELIMIAGGRQKAASALGLEEREALAIAKRIEDLAASLIARYPGIERVARENGIDGCSSRCVESFSRMWDGGWKEITAGHTGPGHIVAMSKIQYIKYILTLTLCAVGSGGNIILYLACAYLAYCHYSEDSAIC